MNIRSLTRITFARGEAQHLSTVLNKQVGLCPELEALRDSLIEVPGLSLGDDFVMDVTLPLEVLRELTYVFSKRKRTMDVRLGLSPERGYNIAESFVTAFARARRYDADVTSDEVNPIVELFGGVAA